MTDHKSFHLTRLGSKHYKPEKCGADCARHTPRCYKLCIDDIDTYRRVVFEKHITFPLDPNPYCDRDIVVWKTKIKCISDAITLFLSAPGTINPDCKGYTPIEVSNAKHARIARTLGNIRSLMSSYEVLMPCKDGISNLMNSAVAVQNTLGLLENLHVMIKANGRGSGEKQYETNLKCAFYRLWPQSLWPMKAVLSIGDRYGAEESIIGCIQQLKTFKKVADEVAAVIATAAAAAAAAAAAVATAAAAAAAAAAEVAANIKMIKDIRAYEAREEKRAKQIEGHARLKKSRKPDSLSKVEGDRATRLAAGDTALVNTRYHNEYCVPLSCSSHPFIVPGV